MKQLLLSFTAFLPFISNAQKGLDEMIATEKAFAAYSVANGAKDAFLKFMDTSAIMFKDGEPYKSYKVWMKKEKANGVVNWRPRYAEMSSSGDFGWTAGPWTFQPKAVSDSVVANGYFFTIWKKNSAGEWKFILDVGIDTGRLEKDTTIYLSKIKTGKSTYNKLFKAEQDYIAHVEKDAPFATYKYYGSPAIIAARYISLTSAFPNPYVPDQPVKSPYKFKIGKGNIASSGDLGYIYGGVEKNGKTATYLHVWRYINGEWQLALEMIQL